VQTCIIHLIRNTFRFASRHYWEEMGKDLRPVYTAPTEAAAVERFEEFDAKWGGQYPAITKLWQNAWSEFVPFLDWDVRVPQRPLPPRREGARALPQRRCGAEVPLPRDPLA